MFFGETADTLAAQRDTLTDRISETLRQWAEHARERGVAAVFEAAQLNHMGERVLSWVDGERHMTDLAHLTQVLHDTAHRNHLSLSALRDWLRAQREERGGTVERNRRLDSDAAAVQVMTVWVSKGLQFPVVYLPFAFNRNVQTREVVMFHDGDTRCLHVGGQSSPDYPAVAQQSRREAAADDVRLTYVAMTRAQSQVISWWAPSNDEPNGGLSRLLRGRKPGDPMVPDRCDPSRVDDPDAMALLRHWADEGGPVLEESLIAPAVGVELHSTASDLAVRHFHRLIDTEWRRTSYSGLIRDAEAPGSEGVSSQPEVLALDDELESLTSDAAGSAALSASSGSDLTSPMADMPKGAKFGTLVHAVLETSDPFATDLVAELKSQIEVHSAWWPIDVPGELLAAAMVPLHDTPLGSLAADMTLRQIGFEDRLQELDFELPLAGGDLPVSAPAIRLADVGLLLREHLPATDPLACYADRLLDGPLSRQSLRGYLTGSVDAVLRIGERYLVVDYKTNWLGTGTLLTAADYQRPRLVEAMLHSDYLLQALLYSVVLHRFLRWRQPGYDPETHLGGVLYLFLRGMCGPETPHIEGHPAGVFSWLPPATLVAAVSDLLDAGRAS